MIRLSNPKISLATTGELAVHVHGATFVIGKVKPPTRAWLDETGAIEVEYGRKRYHLSLTSGQFDYLKSAEHRPEAQPLLARPESLPDQS